MHLNTGNLRVHAGGLLLGYGNLQNKFSLRLDSKIGPSVSKDCCSLVKLLFLGAFAKFAKSDC